MSATIDTTGRHMRGQIAIIGAAESNEIGKLPNKSQLQLHLESALNAIRDCGIDKSQIDGIAAVNRDPVQGAHALGIVPTYVDGTGVGGC